MAKKLKSNVTLSRLAGLPFRRATDLKRAQDEIQLAVWRRLEEARAIDSLTKRPEYDFWREEFKAGLNCVYDAEDSLVRVYSDGPGVKVRINQDQATTIPASGPLLGALVQSMSQAFADVYYRAKGMLPQTAAESAGTSGEKSKGERHT